MRCGDSVSIAVSSFYLAASHPGVRASEANCARLGILGHRPPAFLEKVCLAMIELQQEIDGLRALAVHTQMILFHAGLGMFHKGFIDSSTCTS